MRLIVRQTNIRCDILTDVPMTTLFYEALKLINNYFNSFGLIYTLLNSCRFI